MRVTAVLVVLMLITLPVNAYTFQGNVQHTGNFTSNAKIVPKLQWKTYVSGLVGSSPVVANGKVFVTNWYGWGNWQPGFYVLDANTGRILWNNSTIYGASTPFVYGDKVVVGGMVYSGSGWDYYGYLYIINLTTHEVKSVELDDHPSYYGIASSPIVYNGYIYVLTHSNGTLWKLDLDGNVIDRFTTGGLINPYTSPTAYDGKIFFAGNFSGDNRIYCVYTNLTEVWNRSVDSQIMDTPTIANVSGETLLLFTTKNYIYAFYLNGTLKDRYRLNGTISSPAVVDNKIYVGSKDGKLYCLTINSSGKFEVLWTFQANGKIDSSPAVANGVVYFATNTGEGTLYAIDASNGYELWHFRLLPPQNTWWNIMSSPFIYDGKLYIGADSGYVYCFNSSGVIGFNVNLTPLNVTVNVNGNSYQVRENTALGALLKASNYTNDSYEIYFNVTLDDSWYSQYGSFFISSIMGLGTQNVNSNWIYWSIWNETSPLSVGANLYTVRDGESIYYCYGDGSSLSNCIVLLNITTHVKPVGISNLRVNSARLGGNATAYVNVTSAESGWYVVVVSGLNDNGDYVAGISTFYLSEGQSLRVPVLIHVPQRNTAGTYKLFAGVYRLNDYPNNLIDWFGSVNCEVSS